MTTEELQQRLRMISLPTRYKLAESMLRAYVSAEALDGVAHLGFRHNNLRQKLLSSPGVLDAISDALGCPVIVKVDDD